MESVSDKNTSYVEPKCWFPLLFYYFLNNFKLDYCQVTIANMNKYYKIS